ncbi:hypothetical protein BsWGS_00668 [Bradybaena similaris]
MSSFNALCPSSVGPCLSCMPMRTYINVLCPLSVGPCLMHAKNVFFNALCTPPHWSVPASCMIKMFFSMHCVYLCAGRSLIPLPPFRNNTLQQFFQTTVTPNIIKVLLDHDDVYEPVFSNIQVSQYVSIFYLHSARVQKLFPSNCEMSHDSHPYI